MSWNDGYERKKHQEELDKEIELLRLNGNTESEINSWIEESWKGYRITRWHAMHMQSINITYFDDQNDETDNPLLRKFLDVMSVTEEYKDSAEFGWMESIENMEMYRWLKALPVKEKRLMTCVVEEGLTLKAAAEKCDIPYRSGKRYFETWKNFLRNF